MPHSRPAIAVVDDDAGIRAALADLFDAADYGAETFPSAEDFLARGAGRDFACLISDVHLPGMTGVDLVEALATRGAALPAVLISGHDDPATMAMIQRVPATPHLRKPFSDDELFDALHRAMRL